MISTTEDYNNYERLSKGELVPLTSHGVYLKLIQNEHEAIAALRMYAEIAVVHNDMVRQMKISAD